MKFVTVSELRLKATQIVKEIEETKEEVVVTKNGKPIVLMRFIDDTGFELKKRK
jgi:PHD/YefM family antitoxin component YafN of YafNO toxin-antitoxin module